MRNAESCNYQKSKNQRRHSEGALATEESHAWRGRKKSNLPFREFGFLLTQISGDSSVALRPLRMTAFCFCFFDNRKICIPFSKTGSQGRKPPSACPAAVFL